MKLLFALSLLVTANTLAVPPPRSAVQATPSEPTQRAMPPKRNLFAPPSSGLFGLETTPAVPQFGPRRTMPESTWLRKKASDGGAVASVALGKYYRVGSGIKENKYASRSWYQRAAKNKDPNGQHAYGMSIIKGEGGMRDIAVGATYLADACANGNPLATEAWSKLEFE